MLLSVKWSHSQAESGGATRLATSRRISKLDQAIILGFLARDPDAWEEVKIWISPLVCSSGWRFDCDPTDIIHETLIVLFDQLEAERFRGGCALKTYVWRIGFYKCVDHHRSRKRLDEQQDITKIHRAADYPDPLQQLLEREYFECVAKVVAELLAAAEPGCLDLWRLRYWEELPLETVATMLGIPNGTAKSRASRCNEKARIALRANPLVENL